MVEEETQKRIELLIKKRVDTILESRKYEIEEEIKKRVSWDALKLFRNLIDIYFKVEVAKQEMERELMKDLEKRREERYNEEKRREVGFRLFVSIWLLFELTQTL